MGERRCLGKDTLERLSREFDSAPHDSRIQTTISVFTNQDGEDVIIVKTRIENKTETTKFITQEGMNSDLN